MDLGGEVTCKCRLPDDRTSLRRGDPLFDGDRIRLDEDEEVSLVFTKGEVVSVTLRGPAGAPTTLPLSTEGTEVLATAKRKGLEVEWTTTNALFSAAHAMTFSEAEYSRAPVTTAHYTVRPVRGHETGGSELRMTEVEAAELRTAEAAFATVRGRGQVRAAKSVLAWLYGAYHMPHRAWTCVSPTLDACGGDAEEVNESVEAPVSAVWVSDGGQAEFAAACEPDVASPLVPKAVHAALPGTVVRLHAGQAEQARLVVAGPDGRVTQWAAPVALRITSGGVELAEGTSTGSWTIPNAAELLLDARVVDELVGAGLEPSQLAGAPMGPCAEEWAHDPSTEKAEVARAGLVEAMPGGEDLATLAVAAGQIRRGNVEGARHLLAASPSPSGEHESPLFLWSRAAQPSQGDGVGP